MMLKKIISAFFTRASVALFMLLNLLIVSRYLGSAVLGELSLFVLNIAIIHAVAEIYSGSALVYFIPNLNLKKVYMTGIVWIFFCCLLVNVVLLLLSFLWAHWASTSSITEELTTVSWRGNAERGLAIHVLMISFISAVNAFHNVLLLAKENTRVYNFMVFFQPACMVGILAVNVFFLHMTGVFACVLALYISHLLALVFSAFTVVKLVYAPGEKSNFNLKSILRNGIINQMGNLAHILSNRFNFYMIGIMSIAMVGVYSSATSLIESVWIISISISPLVLTHIANKRNLENNSNLTFVLAKISFLLSLLCILIIYFIPSGYFTALLGKDFSETKRLMLYLSPGVLAVSFSSIISHYFSGLGQQRILLIANVAGLMVTLLTSYFFISRMGAVGACFVGSAAYLVQAVVLTVWFMNQNQFGIQNIFTLRKDLRLLGHQPAND